MTFERNDFWDCPNDGMISSVHAICPICGITRSAAKIRSKNPIKKSTSKYELLFLDAMRLLAPDLPLPDSEQFQLASMPKYFFDFAYTAEKIIIECDGGENIPLGGHGFGERFVRDRLKQNQATLEGWRILRFAGSQLSDNPQYCVDCVRTLLIIKRREK